MKKTFSIITSLFIGLTCCACARQTTDEVKVNDSVVQLGCIATPELPAEVVATPELPVEAPEPPVEEEELELPLELATPEAPTEEPSVEVLSPEIPAETGIVQAGEGWMAVARRYGVDYKELAAANGRSIDDPLKIGEELVLPQPTGPVNDPELPVEATESHTEVAEPEPPANEEPSVEVISPEIPAETAIVQAGEGWMAVARRYGVDYKELAAVNGRSIDDPLKIGEELVLPQSTGQIAAPEPTANSVTMADPEPPSDEEILAARQQDSFASSEATWYNICHSLDVLQGMTIAPGETFSWFTNMGPCGEADGYKESLVYNGQGSPSRGYGGGICYTSTMLWQCADELGWGGLHYDHSGTVKYAERGEEACISYGSKNMTFTNNGSQTIRIYTWYDTENYSQSNHTPYIALVIAD